MLTEGINILKQFERFKNQFPEGNEEDFGRFLLQENKVKKDSSSYTEALPFDFPVDSINESLGWLLGRLIQFTSIWERKAFSDTALNNNKESGILLYILSHPSCTKSEVAEHSLIENTTIFEIIKKLVRKGYINEKGNKQDKRKKELLLTEKGKAVTFNALSKMKELSIHLMGNLTDDEKATLYSLISKLDKFHEKSYSELKDSDWQLVTLKSRH